MPPKKASKKSPSKSKTNKNAVKTRSVALVEKDLTNMVKYNHTKSDLKSSKYQAWMNNLRSYLTYEAGAVASMYLVLLIFFGAFLRFALQTIGTGISQMLSVIVPILTHITVHTKHALSASPSDVPSIFKQLWGDIFEELADVGLVSPRPRLSARQEQTIADKLYNLGSDGLQLFLHKVGTVSSIFGEHLSGMLITSYEKEGMSGVIFMCVAIMTSGTISTSSARASLIYANAKLAQKYHLNISTGNNLINKYMDPVTSFMRWVGGG